MKTYRRIFRRFASNSSILHSEFSTLEHHRGFQRNEAPRSRQSNRLFPSRPKFVATAAAVITMIGLSHGTIISLDFEGVSQITTVAPSASAGVVPATNWNSLVGLTGTGFSAIEQGGTPAATVDWTAPLNGNIAGNTGFDPDEVMMEGFISALGSPTSTIPASVRVSLSPTTLAGWSSYDIYVYSDTGSGGPGARILHSPSTTMYNHFELFPGYGQSIPGTSTYVDSQASPPGNYVVYSSMTDPVFQIDVFANGNNAAINGIQIVGKPIPEPTTGLLGMLGAASLILFRRRS